MCVFFFFPCPVRLVFQFPRRKFINENSSFFFSRQFCWCCCCFFCLSLVISAHVCSYFAAETIHLIPLLCVPLKCLVLEVIANSRLTGFVLFFKAHYISTLGFGTLGGCFGQHSFSSWCSNETGSGSVLILKIISASILILEGEEV